MQVRRRLTEFESTIAMLAGAGLIVLMLAFLLSSARGGAQASARVLNLPIIDLMVIGGALLLVGALVAWLAVSRPWTTAHDDWATPLYTGHESHAAGSATYDEAAAAVAEPFAHVEELPSTEAPIIHAPAKTTVPPPVIAPEGSVVVTGELPSDAPLGLMPQVAAPDTLPADAVVTDDLTVVEGIGPKIEAALAGAGITTYARLAAQEPAELERVVRAAGVRMVGKALTWPEQARLLAEGRLEEWKALAARLKSGH